MPTRDNKSSKAFSLGYGTIFKNFDVGILLYA